MTFSLRKFTHAKTKPDWICVTRPEAPALSSPWIQAQQSCQCLDDEILAAANTLLTAFVKNCKTGYAVLHQFWWQKMTLLIQNASTVEIYKYGMRKATCTTFMSLSKTCMSQKVKCSITIIKNSYMFTQGFLDKWPALFQVCFSILREQCGKTAFFQQPFGIILSCKGWLFPSIWHSEKFRFINCY